MKLTQDYLKSILKYDPLTGIFIWRHREDKDSTWNTRYAGSTAGTFIDGYVSIRINGMAWFGHQLAFLYMKGYIPTLVDHKDRHRDNNSWANLRISTYTQNQANRGKQSNNTSGYKNVQWNKAKNKWHVVAVKDRKKYYNGLHISLEAAVKAANTLRIKLYGEFAFQEEFRG